MVTVHIPVLLRHLTGGRPQLQATGETVRQVIDSLEQVVPGLRDALVDSGRLRGNLSVAVDGEISPLGLLERVGPDSEVHFVAAIRGGRALLALALLAVAPLPAATIETVAGGGAAPAGAPAQQVKLVEPFGVTFGRRGEWFLCEHKGQRVLRVTRDGRSQPVAGTGEAGYGGDGGPATRALLKDPHGVEMGRQDTLFVADTRNHRVRRIDLRRGTITTIAGTGEPGFSGDGGPAIRATFRGTFAIALNRRRDQLYIVDLGNRRVRRVDLKSGLITTVAGNGETGVPSDGAKAVESPLTDPRAAAVDSRGNLYILERGGNALRVVDTQGLIRTVIAPGTVQPDLRGPKHITIDRQDNVIIADAENHLVRKYTPADGRTTIVAGTGQAGDRIEPADPLRTELRRPHGVSVSPSGDLYISDSYNHRILRLRP